MKNWFSNFKPYAVPLVENGISYPTPEHFYQAQKTKNMTHRKVIASTITPSIAKKEGRLVELRPDWEAIKIKVMYRAQRHRFSNSQCRQTLLATENKPIVEWNTWHDNYWGHCLCVKCQNVEHKNMLGKILMDLRDKIKRGEE